jgi:poly(hydroxyalkanoate) depolymerase family esterase
MRLPSFSFFVVLTVVGAACTSESTNSATPEVCPPKTESLADPAAAALAEVSDFGDNPGGLKMYVHAPAGKTTATAIVLALHGCTQTAPDYADTGWNEIADREGFAVVYGEQATSNNATRCFRWWEDAQIGRSGEAKSLASMVQHAQAQYGTKRAFVTGLSAGGAMTAVMLAAYPDIFEAGAIMAGVPYKCATSQLDAFPCLSGRTKSASEWAALVPAGTLKPRVSIWQGETDSTVRSQNRDELVKQWAEINGVGEEPSETTTEGPATHRVHRDASGVVRVESWAIAKMGHGVALDAKAGCGTAGAFALDVGLCSSARAAAFFLGTSSTMPPNESSSGTPSDPAPCP